MFLAANLDWLYHALGWTLAAAGMGLLVWALFWDRSRGRRRCPKCWYSMEGVPGLRCPECGREAKSTRVLSCTRRRWGIASIALVCILVGTGADAAVWLRSCKWADLPAWVLIESLRWTQTPSLREAIEHKLGDPGFVGSNVGLILDDPPRWLESRLSKHTWTRLSVRMAALLGTPDKTVAEWAEMSIAQGLPDPFIALPYVHAKLRTSDLRSRIDAASTVSWIARRYHTSLKVTSGSSMCKEKMRPLLPDLLLLLDLNPEDQSLRGPQQLATLARLIYTYTPPAARPTSVRSVARGTAATALGDLGYDDPHVVKALQETAKDPDQWLVYYALDALHWCGYVPPTDGQFKDAGSQLVW